MASSCLPINGDYFIYIEANPVDDGGIISHSININVERTFEDNDVNIISPIPNEIINSTPGATYLYKATAHGNRYPDVSFNWTTSRNGYSQYGYYDNLSTSSRVNYNNDRRWK